MPTDGVLDPGLTPAYRIDLLTILSRLKESLEELALLLSVLGPLTDLCLAPSAPFPPYAARAL